MTEGRDVATGLGNRRNSALEVQRRRHLLVVALDLRQFLLEIDKVGLDLDALFCIERVECINSFELAHWYVCNICKSPFFLRRGVRELWLVLLTVVSALAFKFDCTWNFICPIGLLTWLDIQFEFAGTTYVTHSWRSRSTSRRWFLNYAFWNECTDVVNVNALIGLCLLQPFTIVRSLTLTQSSLNSFLFITKSLWSLHIFRVSWSSSKGKLSLVLFFLL